MTTKTINNNNIIEIEEVDESWALKLLNESEQDEVIEVEESTSLLSGVPRPSANLSAIELQILQYEQHKKYHADDALPESNSLTGFKDYLKRIFA